MPRRFTFFIVLSVFVSLVALSFPISSQAETLVKPEYAGTPYDLINAVNALRAANGLSPYSINSTLMYTAQSQADFMAATGNVTHSGPGGIGLTDRILAAGYPLAGDLSLGGFRAENITGGSESMPAQTAIDQWTGDAPHLNTMLSPNLTEIGAGVSIANGRVYYVIDCARPTTSGAPQVSTTDVGGGSAVPAGEAPIRVAVVSTPNSDGDVIHEVQYGQSLWQIAIAYEVKIDDIRRLNTIFGNDIYPGNKLLIKRGVFLPTTSPTESSTPGAMMTSTVTATSTPIIISLTYTSTSVPTSTPSIVSGNNSTVMGIAIGIIALALLGGGIFTWIGSSKKEQ